MYAQAPESPRGNALPKQNQASDINGESIEILQKALSNVAGLQQKVVGPRPSGEGKADEPVRCVMNDAQTIRRLAMDLADGIQLLHGTLGYDKQ